MRYQTRQSGGTLLGLLLGLIIGLGIAAVVAVTINKVPVPFVDRAVHRDRAVNNGSGQLPDLNKSLYGNREPAREAAKQFQKEPGLANAAPGAANAPDAAAATGTSAAPSTGAAKEAKAASAAKAPADAGSMAQDPAKAAASDDKWTYYLQAGAFRAQEDAESAKAKLALLGIEAHVSERAGDTGTLYRVRAGPFAQVEAMNKVRSKLSENGVDVAVVRIAK